MSIFLSYSRNDEETVAALVVGLEAARRDVWFDRDLGGGDAWWDKIIENICCCDVFVFAVSDDSLQSKPCRDEIEYARATGRPVLPIQVGPVTSFRGTPFAGVQVVSFRPNDATAGFEIIAAVDQAAARAQPAPDPPPPPPPIPYGYLHAIGRQIDSVELDPADQLKVVDQLRRALGEESDPTVRRDIFAMLDDLMRKPWSTRRTEKEIRATMFAWDTSSLVAMSPGLEEEMALAREQEQTTVDPPAEAVIEPPKDETARIDGAGVDGAGVAGAHAPEAAPKTPRPVVPPQRRTAALMGAVAGSALVVGLLLGIAVAPQTESAGGAAGGSASQSGTVPGPPVPALPTSAALADDRLVVPVMRGTHWELDLARSGAGKPQDRLVSGPGDARAPLLSKDRQTILYLRIEDEVRTLRVAAADGSGDRPLFGEPPQGCDRITRPAWNPVDPSLLALPCGDSAGVWKLYLIRTDGTVVGSVPLPGARAGDPTWNADGSQLAFWVGNDAKDDAGAIWVANGDGSGARNVSRGVAGQDGDPAWDPQGDTLAFSRKVSDTAADLYTVPGSGSSSPTPVLRNGAANSDPSWSPNGKRIAYLSDAPDSLTALPRTWLMSRAGKDSRVLWADTPSLTLKQGPAAWSRR